MMGTDMMYGYHHGIGWMLFGLVFFTFIVVFQYCWCCGLSEKAGGGYTCTKKTRRWRC